MQKNLRIAAAQINAAVGDLEGNRRKILEILETAKKNNCLLVAFPELALTGYPPEDLVLRKHFVADQLRILQEIAAATEEMVVVAGFVDQDDQFLYNSAAVLQKGRVQAVYRKIHLPNYSVFDEERYFEPGREPMVLQVDTVKIGLSICEDIWIPAGVVESEAFQGGAPILLNISASPYSLGKIETRRRLLQSKAQLCQAYIVYVNLVGGQDELVFDGSSLFVSPDGEILQEAASFAEDLMFCDIALEAVEEKRKGNYFVNMAASFKSPFAAWKTITLSSKIDRPVPLPKATMKSIADDEEEIYQALVLGLQDYVRKNGFRKVVLGLSGGIDSALVAALAADALGAENVIGITMPSQFSSIGSVQDSKKLAENLGIQLLELPITKIFSSYLELLSETFKGLEPDITEENLQARIRGNLVMAISNKFGCLALTTGNKSEVSVGYCTIYGDMAGGFSPLKDVFKTMVYRLAEYRNRRAGFDLIPRAIIEKAPSAELRPNQTDQDSLPPYPLLDQILQKYIEQSKSVQEIVAEGFDEETVRRVAKMVDMSEFKRRQAAPGIKITPLAFGKDRRMPITNLYRV
ncbi:MAG: NAD+ synthase [candidate division KSB1 bacterium]|nr:NAD+ synthase [candidate division KSB1 bacterium]